MNRVIAIVFVAWSSAALAQPASLQAEALFRRGRDLMTAGKIAAACNAFEESQKIEPAVTTLLNLAGCREKLDQIATAWRLFLDAAHQTSSATDPVNRQLHDIAQAHAWKLEPRTSKLTINVPQNSQLDGLEITRGADRLDAQSWNHGLPVDGGSYTITVRAPGMEQWSTQVTVAAENDSKTVEIPELRNLPRRLDKSDDPRPQQLVVAPAIARSLGPPNRSRVVPLVLGAGALALLGGGLGLELSSESSYNAAKSEMMSQSRRDSLYRSANTKRYAAETLAVGGLAVSAAAVWLYYHHDDSHELNAAPDARMHVVPTATGLALSGRF